MKDVTNDERTFRILDIIAGSPRHSQRDIASFTGLSVGTINLILRRLVRTGHIKVSRLNRKKVEYLLTPKGAVEKTTRTYRYVNQTIRTYLGYQRFVDKMIGDLIEKGHRKFVISGEGDLSDLIESSLRSFSGKAASRSLRVGETAAADETVLDCQLQESRGSLRISIMAELLKSGRASNGK